MQDVRELLRRHEAGQSARRIAREMGVDRKTVGRYLRALAAALQAHVTSSPNMAFGPL